MHCSKARLFLASPALLLTNRDYDHFFFFTHEASKQHEELIMITLSVSGQHYRAERRSQN